MNDDLSQAVYSYTSVVHWVQDKNCVIIVAGPSRAVHTLHGVEATLWGWLMLGYSYRQIVELLTALLGLPLGAGHQTLAGILEAWRGQGLVQREERADG